MAVQKHNTYYDSELYYYDENGVRQPLQVGKVYSAGSGIKIENDIISVSGKYVASADTSLDGKSLVLKDNKWEELVLPPSSDWLPTIKEASANSYNAATAWTNAQGYLTAHQIIPSAKWENASDVVVSNSSKWNDGYTTLTANSADWLKEDDIIGLATKDELNTASSTLNTNKLDKTVFDEYKDFVNGELPKKQDKSAMSAYALSSWVDENYQKKGNYLSANALDLISETSGKWNEVSSKLDKNDFTTWSANYDEYVKSIENDVGNLKSNSSNWDSVYNNVNTNSAKWDVASNEVTSHSANWNSVYDTVSSNSANWNNITAINTFSSIGGVPARNSADELLFVPGDNVSITTANNTITFSAKDTTYDENDFISASHLDNIVSVSATVTSNSADWTSAARALEASADKWNTTHEQFNTSSVKWNELYDEYQVSSKLWNDTTDVVNTFSGDWNEVSAKANSADLVELSGKVETLSGELETASAFIEDQIEDLSGAIDNISAVFSADIDYLSGAIDDKLDKDEFDTWSANADVTPYSAGKGLALNGHEFYVSADYAMSADVYNKDEVDEKIAKFGGYTTANADASGYPDVAEPSTKFIYLVKMSNLPASSDNYKEWIYTSTEQTTAWECVGETTLDLSPYLTKAEAEETYQPKGNYVTSSTNEISAVDEYYGLINDGYDVKWAKIPVSDTTYSAGKYIVISGADNEISVSGLFNTTLSSQDESIGISAIPDASGNITYNLSVDKVELPDISGVNGISAYYDEDKGYIVSLDEHTYSYAEAQTSLTTLTTNPETITGFNNKKIIGDNISFVNDVINLEPGLYHIDIQVYLPIPGGDNNYYNVQLVPSKSYATLDQIVDGSFAHNDTLDLSFDIQLDSADTLTFELNGLPPGYKYLVKNIQIHEVTTIDSIMDATGGTYRGGVATNIDNENKINVQYDAASGLAVDPVTNMMYVKLGEGLKFDTSGAAAGSLSLNNVTQEVVETVQTLEQELNGKLTVNMNISDAKVNTQPFYNSPGTPNMGVSLFTVPLNHKLNTNSEISFFTTQNMSQAGSFPICIGIFEYNFQWWDPDAPGGYRSSTTWIGDTGLIWPDTPAKDGNTMEGDGSGNTNKKFTFYLKNLTPTVEQTVTIGSETKINSYGPELRSDRAYYIAFFSRAAQGLQFFLGDEGYVAETHSDPYISWYADNMKYVPQEGEVQNMSNWDDSTWNSHRDDFTLRDVGYWREYRGGEAANIGRPLVMIRNNV